MTKLEKLRWFLVLTALAGAVAAIASRFTQGPAADLAAVMGIATGFAFGLVLLLTLIPQMRPHG